jgi:hypothetical protein
MRRDGLSGSALCAGEAALALGNFRTAYADLSEVARLQPGDTALLAEPPLTDSGQALLAMETQARREKVLGEAMLGWATELWAAAQRLAQRWLATKRCGWFRIA